MTLSIFVHHPQLSRALKLSAFIAVAPVTLLNDPRAKHNKASAEPTFVPDAPTTSGSTFGPPNRKGTRQLNNQQSATTSQRIDAERDEHQCCERKNYFWGSSTKPTYLKINQNLRN
jgi:hypothetical protein